MGRLLKRACAWLLAAAIALSCAGALAEFSPRYEKLMNGEGVTLTLSAQLKQMSKMKKTSLETLNDWLEGLVVTMSLGGDTEAAVRLNGDDVFWVRVQRESGYNLTSFGPDGGAYMTAPDKADALELLSGDSVSLPDWSQAPGAYVQMAPKLYDMLSSHVTPTAAKQTTTIKNAAKAASNELYTFTGDDLTEFWPRVLDVVYPALEELLSGQPGLCAQIEETLDDLTFSGECKFKRFLDKEGRDMGLQFTGNAELGEEKRKVTLFYGFTPDKGGYISFSAPAVKEKNNLKITCGVQLTGKNGVNTVTLEGTYTRTLDKKTVSGSLNATLKNVIKEGDEAWSGKVTLSRTADKVKSTWTLTPALTFTDEGLTGEIALIKKQGGNTVAQATITAALTPYHALNIPPAASAKDLRGLSDERAQSAVALENLPLIETLAELMGILSAADRDALLHDLRTDAWMNGPVAPALESAAEEAADLEADE